MPELSTTTIYFPPVTEGCEPKAVFTTATAIRSINHQAFGCLADGPTQRFDSSEDAHARVSNAASGSLPTPDCNIDTIAGSGIADVAKLQVIVNHRGENDQTFSVGEPFFSVDMTFTAGFDSLGLQRPLLSMRGTGVTSLRGMPVRGTDEKYFPEFGGELRRESTHRGLKGDWMLEAMTATEGVEQSREGPSFVGAASLGDGETTIWAVTYSFRLQTEN